MAKRKLSEQANRNEKPRDTKVKKAKVQHDSASEAKVPKVSKSSELSKPKPKPVALVPVEPKITKPKALRIVVGSYEKVLCGIDARFTPKSADKRNLKLNPVYMFSAHTGAIKCLAANNRYLVSGGSDEVIKIYDLKKRKDLGSLVQHNGAITALQFYSKTHLLSASEDGTICIWRTRDWECMATMKGHKGRVNGMCVHPSGKIAISVGKDKALRLWNLMTGRKASVTKLGEEAFEVRWNAEGNQYAILFDRKVVIYNMDAEAQVSIEHSVRIHCIRYFQHPVHGETILLGTDDKQIRIHSVSDGSLLQELKGHRARVKAFDALVMSHDDEDVQVLASASSDGEVKTWIVAQDGSVAESGSYDSGNRLMCLALHDAAIEQLDNIPLSLKYNADSDPEVSSDEANSEGEDEWNGIEDK